MYRIFEGAVRGAVIRIPPLYREWPNAISKGRYGGIKGITRGGARPNALLLGESRVLWKDFRTYIPPEYYVIMETLEKL